jgi:GTP cyclohydrolase I
MSYDSELGWKVHEHLMSLGLETPTIPNALTDHDKKVIIEQNVKEIMVALGLDATNDSLRDTPRRIAKMYVDEVFKGLNYEHFPKIMTFENSFKNAGMVVEKGIKVNSACSHHFVPTIGTAVVGYIPNSKVLGLSKINRVVDFFARRPQEQERYGMQVLETLKFILGSNDVAVYIDASHYCVKWRGVENDDATMVVSCLSGEFMNNPTVRQEFYSLALKQS